MNLKEYLNKPTYAIDRPWVIVLLNSMVVALILAIFEPFHYRLNSVIQFWVLWCFVGLTFIFSVVAFVLFLIRSSNAILHVVLYQSASTVCIRTLVFGVEPSITLTFCTLGAHFLLDFLCE